MSIGAVKTIRRHHGEEGLVERMARLERFVARTSLTPHVWGATDCSLMVADWCVENGHEDPAAAWRGSYSTEDECRALIAQKGDLAGVVAGCAAVAALKPIREPAFGCVAVVGSAATPERQWSAIWNGHNWLVRWLSADRRPMWAHFSAKPLAMWRV